MSAKRLKLIAIVVLALTAGSTAAIAQTFNPSTSNSGAQLSPQQPEAPVSPGMGAPLNSTNGLNPLTGLPCTGAGSLAVSGAGALPGTSTPPPNSTSTTPTSPSFNSVFGSSSAIGAC